MRELIAVRRLHQQGTAMPRPSRQPTGFTLIELMFVVLLIGVMAALIAPGLSQGRREAEIANFATGMVRLGSRARAQAQASGLAHALVLNANGTAATFQLFRGTSPRCNSVPWNWGGAPLDGLRTSDTRYSTGGVLLQLQAVDNAAAAIRICIQPNGVTLLRNGDVPALGGFMATINGGGGALINDIEFRLFHGPSLTQRTGAERRVVFPSGNIPRWAQ